MINRWTEAVVNEVIAEQVVPNLVSLLQLNVPELQASIAETLTHVAANGT